MRQDSAFNAMPAIPWLDVCGQKGNLDENSKIFGCIPEEATEK